MRNCFFFFLVIEKDFFIKMTANNRTEWELDMLKTDMFERINKLAPESIVEILYHIKTAEAFDKKTFQKSLKKSFSIYGKDIKTSYYSFGNLPTCDYISKRSKLDQKPLASIHQVTREYPGLFCFALKIHDHTQLLFTCNVNLYYYILEFEHIFQFYSKKSYIWFYFFPGATYEEKQDLAHRVIYFLRDRFVFIKYSKLFNIEAEFKIALEKHLFEESE